MGGRQRSTRVRRPASWRAYDEARLLELDTASGAIRTVLSYTSRPEHVPPQGGSHVFMAGSWDGDTLLLCTRTEVVRFDPRRERVVEVLSHPWMNDVHHVCRVAGRLHVVSTGLDAVLVLDDGGAVVESISATEAPVFAARDRGVDYRRIPSMKPHAVHPNFVFERDGLRWVTRLHPGDALCLDERSRRISLADAPVHDGVAVGGARWFTTVPGELLRVDAGGDGVGVDAVAQRVDLASLGGPHTAPPLGWCRGVAFDGDLAFVGFSRLRPTPIKQNLRWLRKPLGKPDEAAPTRLVAYDLAGGGHVATWELEDAGVQGVFGVVVGR